MNAGAVIIISNNTQNLIEEYAALLQAQGKTLNIGTLNWVEYM